MPSKKDKSNQYLAMWDNQGLECILNVTEHLNEIKTHEKKVMWNILKDPDFKDVGPPKLPLQQMILRAKFNSQRSYEIYEFTSTMSLEELRSVFDETPQPIVEWIRKNGYKIYSDYVPANKKVIS